MVKKLCKYEIASYVKTMLPMLAVLGGVAVLNRIIQFFETDTTAYNIFFKSSLVFLIITMLVCLVMAFAVSVIRFYRNMFTQEGYLTMTLPVTPSQHLFAKTLTAFLCCVVTALTVLAAAAVASSGEPLVEVYKAVVYLLGKFVGIMGKTNAVFIIIEAAVAVLLSLVSALLLFYGCCSVGQLAKKNKILLSVGVYFGYYFICQMLGTVLVIIFAVLSMNQKFMENVLRFISNHFALCAHGFMIGIIIFELVIILLYSLVSKAIIKKKLNIE